MKFACTVAVFTFQNFASICTAVCRELAIANQNDTAHAQRSKEKIAFRFNWFKGQVMRACAYPQPTFASWSMAEKMVVSCGVRSCELAV